MKEVTVTIDDTNNMIDANGAIMMSLHGTTYQFKEAKKQVDIEKLVALGVSPDDLMKMKASDLI